LWGKRWGFSSNCFLEIRAKQATNCDKLCREAEKRVTLRRRKIDGCPIAGALQLIGDKWTLLVVRELYARPKRTTELLEELHPISSRTLMGRLKEMESDRILLRVDYGGLPRRVEYELTERGRLLLPLLDALMKTGEVLDCNQCEDRKQQLGYYCDFCPNVREETFVEQPQFIEEIAPAPAREPAPSLRPKDDSIVLL
jgi:DNA-binding HxlR family transcriptional regulator